MGLPCTVLGAGSWGTALAIQLAIREHDVTLWDRNPDRCAIINDEHRNPRYLTGVRLPTNLVAQPNLLAAVGKAALVVSVVPSHATREVLAQCRNAIPSGAVVCCATKGVEEGTLMSMHEVFEDVLGSHRHDQITVLSGPSFAAEVARGLPTAVVVAGHHVAAHVTADAFHGGGFRSYHTEDITGVCLGGSLKNVMAIATGIADGIGLGSNTSAALITRGLAEISRLAVACGANPLTMMGLAGVGDLVLTCTGGLSRNRRVGLGLGAGKSLEEILEELGEVAEGVRTAHSAHDLAKREGVDMPITEQVYRILYEGRPPGDALTDLLRRSRRAERD